VIFDNYFLRVKPTKQLTVFTAFMVLSVILRFFSFFPTQVSHDEGTYFVIAREIFQGKIYFVDLVDTKPIGIFLILGLFIKYVSASIFMIRMFTAAVVAVTAFIIYKIMLLRQKEQKPAVASGIIYIFFVSVWAYFGVFINPELFYLLFTALAFYIFSCSDKPQAFLLLGLMLGVGFILKYVVLFDLTAWLLFYFVTILLKRNSRASWKAFFNSALACIGFLIPFVITIGYYLHVGHLQEFWFYSFGVTSRIPVERTCGQLVIYIADFHLRFFPIVFFFYYALAHMRYDSEKPLLSARFFVIWCLMVLLAVILPGKPFGHYFIQLMLPISLVAGGFFSDNLEKPRWIKPILTYPVGYILLLLMVMGLLILQKRDYYDKPDIPKEVAQYIRPLLQPGDRIYTGNYQQVVYYLLEQDCPVKYVHRTLMCDQEHRSALQVDLPREMNRLMAMNFRFILMAKPYCYEPFNEYIREKYTLIKEIPGVVGIYERK
jgi:hypothetical protein